MLSCDNTGCVSKAKSLVDFEIVLSCWLYVSICIHVHTYNMCSLLCHLFTLGNITVVLAQGYLRQQLGC
jgi:hypothetical protein